MEVHSGHAGSFICKRLSEDFPQFCNLVQILLQNNCLPPGSLNNGRPSVLCPDPEPANMSLACISVHSNMGVAGLQLHLLSQATDSPKLLGLHEYPARLLDSCLLIAPYVNISAFVHVSCIPYQTWEKADRLGHHPVACTTSFARQLAQFAPFSCWDYGNGHMAPLLTVLVSLALLPFHLFASESHVPLFLGCGLLGSQMLAGERRSDTEAAPGSFLCILVLKTLVTGNCGGIPK